MRPRTIRLWWTLASVLAALSLALAACAPAAAPSPTSVGAPTAAPKITLKLAENPWTGSRINVAVAKLLLEKELGYTVELVSIDENAQWAALASGDLSASLEVWPSGHAENIAQFIEGSKQVEDIGKLGVEGKIGWYIPTYMLKDHPELATWEGFKDPANAALFKTAESGEAGQFLGGDPSWVQYDEQIITNLGLNLKVIYAGSEQAILAAVDSAYSRQAPVLIYFYRPHSAFARYDLTNVTLPPNTAECYAKAEAGGVNCDYPTDVLFKIAYGRLKDAAPDAYNLLNNLSYSTQDQISMIAAVDSEGKTPEQAAQAWIDANKATWEKWLGR